jgi:hypothetical protein
LELTDALRTYIYTTLYEAGIKVGLKPEPYPDTGIKVSPEIASLLQGGLASGTKVRNGTTGNPI